MDGLASLPRVGQRSSRSAEITGNQYSVKSDKTDHRYLIIDHKLCLGQKNQFDIIGLIQISIEVD